MNTIINTIIFDAGGVLHPDSHLETPNQAELHQLTGMTPAQLKPYQDHAALNNGEISLLDVLQQIANNSRTGCSAEKLLQAYRRGIVLDQTVVAIARALHATAHYRLIILSNNSDVGIQHTHELLGATGVFAMDGIYGSAEMKISKPDVRAFQYVCEKENVAPQTCLFIDDRDENLASASQLGMQVVKFISAACLNARLLSP